MQNSTNIRPDTLIKEILLNFKLDIKKDQTF